MSKTEEIKQIKEAQRELANRLEAIENEEAETKYKCGDVDIRFSGFAVVDSNNRWQYTSKVGSFVDVNPSVTPRGGATFNIFEVQKRLEKLEAIKETAMALVDSEDTEGDSLRSMCLYGCATPRRDVIMPKVEDLLYALDKDE